MDYNFFREFEALKELVLKHENLLGQLKIKPEVENDKINAEVQSIKN